MSLLAVENLAVEFKLDTSVVHAVNGVSFKMEAGDTLALVGESGCGKSVTSLALMRLVPKPGRIAAGRILFEGRDVTAMNERELRELRGSGIGMIFQDPMTSLNPVYTIGNQIIESIVLHRDLGRAAARNLAAELLDLARMPNARDQLRRYPHQLSGGMRQRAMIAMALAARPRLLIADEPTTALDVSIQAQILELINDIQAETGVGVLLISHDMGVVSQFCREMCVMYAGFIVESGPTAAILSEPAHPYTAGLLACLPETRERGRLMPIPGQPPSLRQAPRGCPFQPRCPAARSHCAHGAPPVESPVEGRTVRCRRWAELELGKEPIRS